MAKTVKIAGASKSKAKKTRITSVSIRENRGKDLSPLWDGYETWPEGAFLRTFHDAMKHYNINLSKKDYKPAVLKWMQTVNYDKDVITQFKSTKDWHCNSTTGGIALCLLRGMPSSHKEINNGASMEEWLRNKIIYILTTTSESISDDEDDETPVTKLVAPVVTIQDRVYDASLLMTDEIEDAIEVWQTDPDNFDPKKLKIVNLLKGKEVKAAHARFIREYYGKILNEFEELHGLEVDEQLKEGYSHRTKKQTKNMLLFLKEIQSACDMLIQEAKAERKVRAKKSVPKDKLVSKLKYLKTFEPLKLVSINPTSIIGAKELWCFDTKTKKLFKYVASEFDELAVNGTSVTGFNESLSIGKTLRKPMEQLAEFNKCGKVSLRTFMDTIKTIDIKATGRINQNQILLKVA